MYPFDIIFKIKTLHLNIKSTKFLINKVNIYTKTSLKDIFMNTFQYINIQNDSVIIDTVETLGPATQNGLDNRVQVSFSIQRQTALFT